MELAGDYAFVAFLLLVVSFVVALGLAVAPTAPPWLTGALASALAVETVWLVLFAAGRDTYFDPQHVTRWEFAGRSDAQWWVVVVIVASIAATVGMGAAFVTRRRWLRHAASVAATIVCVLIFSAAAVLSLGH